MLRLRKQIDYWKEQAGLPPNKRDYVDLVEIEDRKQTGAMGTAAKAVAKGRPCHTLPFLLAACCRLGSRDAGQLT